MRTYFFNSVKTLLTGIKTSDNERFFKTVELWNGQTEMPMEETAFRLPAVFIEMSEIIYEQQLNGRQNANLEFTLHVVTDSRRANLEDCLQGNADLCNLLNSKLYQFAKSNKFGSIVRIRSMQDSQFTEWIENRETYKCNTSDTSALKNYDTAEIDNIAILCGIRLKKS